MDLPNHLIKRIIVFENGNSLNTGCLVIVNPKKYFSWKVFLNHLTQLLSPRFGAIFQLKSVDGKCSFDSMTNLVSDEKYVACGREPYKSIKGG